MKLIIFAALVALTLAQNCRGCVRWFVDAYKEFCDSNPKNEEFKFLEPNNKISHEFYENCKKCSQNIKREDCQEYYELKQKRREKILVVEKCKHDCLRARGIIRDECLKRCESMMN